MATVSCVTVTSEFAQEYVYPSAATVASESFHPLLMSPMCTESESVLQTLDAPAPDPPPATVTV